MDLSQKYPKHVATTDEEYKYKKKWARCGAHAVREKHMQHVLGSRTAHLDLDRAMTQRWLRTLLSPKHKQETALLSDFLEQREKVIINSESSALLSTD